MGWRKPNAGKEFPDGCQTDPEPGMDSRRATVRNMRSKCRCSCVLQFTFRRAVSCVLHRPPSQVIHCIVLYFAFVSVTELNFENTAHNRHPFAGSTKFETQERARILTAVISTIGCWEHRTPHQGHRAGSTGPRQPDGPHQC
jgi:hypothetical protein